MQFFRATNYNFVGIRKQAMLISAILIVAGFISVILHGGFRQSVDFTGGSVIEVRLDQAVPLQEIRDILGGAGFKDAEVTTFGSPAEILIKVENMVEEADTASVEDISNKVKDALSAALTGRTIDMRRTESVGPKIGGELRTAAFWSIIYSLIGLIVYISWRFEFRFAIAAILALVHDVCITLGFFSITNREISLMVIAAVLTIVGYSLNDTIVVFDRIRENMRSRRRENFAQLINASINETLSRTIITAMTTVFVILCLVFLGGEVIRDFALAMLVGVVSGTYSSIFIASPILIWWHTQRGKSSRGTLKIKRANKPAIKPAK
jgi:preprotein translocase subunit SecF